MPELVRLTVWVAEQGGAWHRVKASYGSHSSTCCGVELERPRLLIAARRSPRTVAADLGFAEMSRQPFCVECKGASASSSR